MSLSTCSPRVVAVLLVLALEIGPRGARAQSNEAAATELFEAGRDLMKAGSFADACPKLAASLRLDAKVGTLARLAECEEHVGQMANAHAHWARAQSLAGSSRDPRLARIQVEFARIDRVVSKLDVELAGPASPGIALRIDGIDVGSSSFGLPLPVERGKHAIEVRAEGKTPWSTEVEVASDGAVLKVQVPALEDIPPPPPIVAAEPVAPPSSEVPLERRYRTPGFVVGGVGLAAVGTSILVGLLAAKKNFDDSNAAGCSQTVCPTPQAQQERASAITAGNVATGVFIGGVVVAGVGVTMVLLPGTRKASPRTALRLGAGSFALEGRF